MYRNLRSAKRLRPLTIGNIISIGLRLYKLHLKTYLKLSLFAQLWGFLPIYGWGKYHAIAGLISRRAFANLTNQPESVEMARQQVNDRLRSFLGLWFLLFLIYMPLFAAGYWGIFTAMMRYIQSVMSASVMFDVDIEPPVTDYAIPIGISIIAFMGMIWLFSRLMIPEVSLAVEEGATANQSIFRSWSLTKVEGGRMIGIVITTLLITLPILLPLGIGPSLLMTKINPEFMSSWQSLPLKMLHRSAVNTFVFPIWQTVKAVVYYDLRSRKEGLDLQLRNLNPLPILNLTDTD